MGALGRYLAAAELRRRWRSTVLLALLVALVVGSVLTTTAAARRTGTAVDRYLAEYRAMDLLVFGGDLDAREALAEAPSVERYIAGVAYAVFPADVEGFFPMVAFDDGAIPGERQRPPLLEGRRADPDDPFELVLGERMAAILGVGVGDQLPMLSFTVDEAEVVFAQGDDVGLEPSGPSFDMEVVGIAREPGDLSGRSGDITITPLTPAFPERFAAEMGTISAITFVDLAPGATAADVNRDGGGAIEVDPAFSRETIRRQSAPATSALRTGLFALAAAIALAGVVSVSQAVARIAQSAVAGDAALRALGCQRAARLARLAAPGAVAVGIGTVVGAIASVLASPLHPIGVARRAEPDPGVDVDWTVLGLGLVAALAVGAALVAFAGHRALHRRVDGATRPHRLVTAATRAGASATVVSGLRLATGTGAPGTTAVRTAWSAACAGSLGVLAAVVFAGSIDQLASSPALYGWSWDAQVAGADGSQVSDGDVSEADLFADEDIAALAEVVFSLTIEVDGTPVQTMAIDEKRGHIEPVVVRGRAPSAPDELALGGRTLEGIGRDVDDVVEVAIDGEPMPFRIVGVVALPVPEDGGLSAEGSAMTLDGALSLGFSGNCDGDVSCFRNYALRLAPGTDVEALDERYSSDVVAVDLPIPPGEVQQLQAVDRLPWVLAGFLLVLAVVAVGHTAWATVRHRRRDLTVLRCLGFTGSQLRTMVAVQVAVLAVSGSVAGVVAGVVAGRALWGVVVDRLSLPFASDVPWLWIAGVPVATLVIAELVATLPRRAASRLRVVDALRVE